MLITRWPLLPSAVMLWPRNYKETVVCAPQLPFVMLSRNTRRR